MGGAGRWGRDHVVELTGAATTMALVLVLTRHGLLVDPDSITYLKTARAFADDPTRFWAPPSGTALSIRGLFPPGYPAALALVDAQALGVALAGASTWLLASLVRRAASATTAAITIALIAGQRGYLLVTYGFLMSEGLATVLALAAVTLAVPLVDRPATGLRWRRALAVGGSAGLAVGTRFVAAGALAGLVVAIAWLGTAPLAQRARSAAIALAAGLAPIVVWTWVIAQTGATNPRRITFIGFVRSDLPDIEHLTSMFLPRQVLDALGSGGRQVVGVVVLAAAIVWSVRVVRAAARSAAPDPTRVAALLVLAGWGHLAVLVASHAFTDRLIPLSGRHVMFWTTCLLAAGSIDVHRHLAAEGSADRHPWLRPATIGLACVLLVGALPALVRSLADPVQAWSNLGQDPPSTLAQAADRLPPDLVIYSNREDRIYLETGRETRALPLTKTRYSAERDPAFPARTEAMAAEVRAGRAAIVVFLDDPDAVPGVDVLEARTDATVVHRDDEGVILRGAAP